MSTTTTENTVLAFINPDSKFPFAPSSCSNSRARAITSQLQKDISFVKTDFVIITTRGDSKYRLIPGEFVPVGATPNNARFVPFPPTTWIENGRPFDDYNSLVVTAETLSFVANGVPTLNVIAPGFYTVIQKAPLSVAQDGLDTLLNQSTINELFAAMSKSIYEKVNNVSVSTFDSLSMELLAGNVKRAPIRQFEMSTTDPTYPNGNPAILNGGAAQVLIYERQLSPQDFLAFIGGVCSFEGMAHFKTTGAANAGALFLRVEVSHMTSDNTTPVLNLLIDTSQFEGSVPLGPPTVDDQFYNLMFATDTKPIGIPVQVRIWGYSTETVRVHDLTISPPLPFPDQSVKALQMTQWGTNRCADDLVIAVREALPNQNFQVQVITRHQGIPTKDLALDVRTNPGYPAEWVNEVMYLLRYHPDFKIYGTTIGGDIQKIIKKNWNILQKHPSQVMASGRASTLGNFLKGISGFFAPIGAALGGIFGGPGGMEAGYTIGNAVSGLIGNASTIPNSEAVNDVNKPGAVLKHGTASTVSESFVDLAEPKVDLPNSQHVQGGVEKDKLTGKRTIRELNRKSNPSRFNGIPIFEKEGQFFSQKLLRDVPISFVMLPKTTEMNDSVYLNMVLKYSLQIQETFIEQIQVYIAHKSAIGALIKVFETVQLKNFPTRVEILERNLVDYRDHRILVHFPIDIIDHGIKDVKEIRKRKDTIPLPIDKDALYKFIMGLLGYDTALFGYTTSKTVKKVGFAPGPVGRETPLMLTEDAEDKPPAYGTASTQEPSMAQVLQMMQQQFQQQNQQMQLMFQMFGKMQQQQPQQVQQQPFSDWDPDAAVMGELPGLPMRNEPTAGPINAVTIDSITGRVAEPRAPLLTDEFSSVQQHLEINPNKPASGTYNKALANMPQANSSKLPENFFESYAAYNTNTMINKMITEGKPRPQIASAIKSSNQFGYGVFPLVLLDDARTVEFVRVITSPIKIFSSTNRHYVDYSKGKRVIHVTTRYNKGKISDKMLELLFECSPFLAEGEESHLWIDFYEWVTVDQTSADFAIYSAAMLAPLIAVTTGSVTEALDPMDLQRKINQFSKWHSDSKFGMGKLMFLYSNPTVIDPWTHNASSLANGACVKAKDDVYRVSDLENGLLIIKYISKIGVKNVNMEQAKLREANQAKVAMYDDNMFTYQFCVDQLKTLAKDIESSPLTDPQKVAMNNGWIQGRTRLMKMKSGEVPGQLIGGKKGYRIYPDFRRYINSQYATLQNYLEANANENVAKPKVEKDAKARAAQQELYELSQLNMGYAEELNPEFAPNNRNLVAPGTKTSSSEKPKGFEVEKSKKMLDTLKNRNKKNT